MRLSVPASSLAFAAASHAWAHGDQPHPKCKKGYVPNDAPQMREEKLT
jgi:hypothetical protein